MQQAQQQQIEHQNQLRIQQEEEEKMRLEGVNNSRPEEHFLTIALNGTYHNIICVYICHVVW